MLTSEPHVRLRGEWYAHRRCATYRIRSLGGLAAEPGVPARRAAAIGDPELASRWSE